MGLLFKRKKGFIKIMNKFFYILVIAFCFINTFAQGTNGLQKMVETEIAFARTATEKDTKTAFLEFLADDGITFNPMPGNGKEAWGARPISVSNLAWSPEFADISTNGVVGYTTGPWEFRPNGKNDAPTGFGHFVTLWQRQLNGNYKFILDIGISHEKVNLTEKWTSPADSGKELNEKKISAADSSTYFFEMAEKIGILKAYKSYVADDIRLFREGKTPFVGKKAALDILKKDKSKIKFARRSMFFSAGDLAYISNGYALLDNAGKEIDKGNFLQIWKFRKDKWMIVLDLFRPIPNGK